MARLITIINTCVLVVAASYPAAYAYASLA